MLKNTDSTRSRRGMVWSIGIISIVVVGLLVWITLTPRLTPKIINNPGTLAGIQTGDAPWAPELAHLAERLNAIGLPILRSEGSALHIHQHLDIVIDGKSVPVSAGIGVNQRAGFISDIHTHDASGIIHIESPKIQTFTLGQFLDIWGVSFTSESIGGYKNKDNTLLKIFVNGVAYEGDPRQLELKAYQEIVITYGTDKELPDPIPSTYAFPAGV